MTARPPDPKPTGLGRRPVLWQCDPLVGFNGANVVDDVARVQLDLHLDVCFARFHAVSDPGGWNRITVAVD